eukprot:13146389-Alexandrium_andersonii.AAC.1
MVAKEQQRLAQRRLGQTYSLCCCLEAGASGHREASGESEASRAQLMQRGPTGQAEVEQGQMLRSHIWLR